MPDGDRLSMRSGFLQQQAQLSADGRRILFVIQKHISLGVWYLKQPCGRFDLRAGVVRLSTKKRFRFLMVEKIWFICSDDAVNREPM